MRGFAKLELKVESKERLDKFLASYFVSHSRSKLSKLVDQGLVLVDGKQEKSSFMLSPGSIVTLDEPSDVSEVHDLSPADIPLEVPYEDDFLLVVNKPRGLATHPATTLKEPSLVNALIARSHGLSQVGGEFRPGIVHRLDKDTTGLLVIAKSDSIHVALAKQIESKTAHREYLAVVGGDVLRDSFTIDAPIARDKHNRLKMAVDPHGKPARTHVTKIGQAGPGTLVRCKLETGRTHQIRVHLRAMGHPVLGDKIYAPKEWHGYALQLHATKLEFIHPVTADLVSVECSPPPDFLS